MFSNRLGVTKIMMLTDQAVKEFLYPGSAYLLEMDRKKVVNRALNRGLVSLYFGGFSPVGKRIGKLALGRR